MSKEKQVQIDRPTLLENNDGEQIFLEQGRTLQCEENDDRMNFTVYRGGKPVSFEMPKIGDENERDSE